MASPKLVAVKIAEVRSAVQRASEHESYDEDKRQHVLLLETLLEDRIVRARRVHFANDIVVGAFAIGAGNFAWSAISRSGSSFVAQATLNGRRAFEVAPIVIGGYAFSQTAALSIADVILEAAGSASSQLLLDEFERAALPAVDAMLEGAP